MDSSSIGNWLGIITGVITLSIWTWGLVRKVAAKLADAKRGAELAGKTVEQLMDQATSPAKRADIHAFIQFRCTEIETGRARRMVFLVGAGAFLVLTTFIYLQLFKRFDGAVKPITWWIFNVLYFGVLLAYISRLFYHHLADTYETGWHANAHRILFERAIRHVAEKDNA